MASIIFPFFFFPLLLPLLSSSTSRALPPPPPPPIIQKTCNATTYYSFCISSLSSSPPPNPTIQDLSTSLINLAIANATSTSSYATSLANNTATTNPPLSSLLTTCAEKYMHARESLQSSLDSMSNENYDYAFVHVSAAQEYPNVCHVLFQHQGSSTVVYPEEIAKREDVLERLCTVALEIISLLQVDGANNKN